MDNIVMCTTNSCPMADKCYRCTQGNPDDPFQSYVNYEYTCNEKSGFNDFIPYISK
ncbi:MAG TPA: hypothetical protein VJ083_08980 [Sedimentibacter sp.]|nr:hypothetical protein [Sedimentibacter sp.]